MRTLSLLIVLGATQIGAAQTSTLNATAAWTGWDQSIQDMFKRLHDKAYDSATGITGLYFHMEGVTRLGDGVTGVRQAVAYYRYNPNDADGKADLKFNLINSHPMGNKSHVDSEVRADGKTMWHYVPDAMTYSVATYDISQAGSPVASTYISDALNTVNLVAPATGGPSYAMRLLSEIFVKFPANPDKPFYSPWLITPAGPTSINGPYQDALTGLYRDQNGLEVTKRPTRDQNAYYIVYQNSYNGTPTKEMAFEIYVNPNLDDTDPDKQTIRRIYMTDSTPQNMLAPTGLRKKTVYNTWSIEVSPITDFSNARFTPVTVTELPALPQWKPIVIPNAVRG